MVAGVVVAWLHNAGSMPMRYLLPGSLHICGECVEHAYLSASSALLVA